METKQEKRFTFSMTIEGVNFSFSVIAEAEEEAKTTLSRQLQAAITELNA